MHDALRRGDRVHVRSLGPGDRGAFLDAVERSRDLHHPWVAPPDTPEAFARYTRDDPSRVPMGVVRNDDEELVGVVNLSEIVRGAFCSAFLGYYAFAPFERHGYLREGIDLAVRHAFDDLGLHRVQANVRPENVASSELLRSLGFRLESHSSRYLFLDGAWRDHLGFVRLDEPTPPVAGSHGPVTLHEVRADDDRDLLALRVGPDQERFVADVSRYLSICLLRGQWQPVAIRAAGRAVGFAMWARDPADGSYWLGGFLIDADQQGKGLGRAALRALLEMLRGKPGCEEVALSYRPDNEVAKALYTSAGFVETGETEGDEVVARLRLVEERRRS